MKSKIAKKSEVVNGIKKTSKTEAPVSGALESENAIRPSRKTEDIISETDSHLDSWSVLLFS